MEDPVSVLQKTFENRALRVLYTLAQYKWIHEPKHVYIYDWEQLGELVLDYIYGYAWTDKLLKQHPTCPICLQPMWNPKKTVCNHQFHKSCIRRWMETGNDTCPMCRNNL
ncbi:hypothetical protein CDAR_12831 [Caerostris darwini]|uniref:RING-type domain-containing protein n=1 Tax=Caerostris darwini TaxID=1538125 RepID=A0AAV4NBH6_9ARAC|nr:hypothetical protein CDAR_12831 [Caerostris darwini]